MNFVFRLIGTTMEIDYNVIFNPNCDAPGNEILTSELIDIQTSDAQLISMGINIQFQYIFQNDVL